MWLESTCLYWDSLAMSVGVAAVMVYAYALGLIHHFAVRMIGTEIVHMIWVLESALCAAAGRLQVPFIWCLRLYFNISMRFAAPVLLLLSSRYFYVAFVDASAVQSCGLFWCQGIIWESRITYFPERSNDLAWMVFWISRVGWSVVKCISGCAWDVSCMWIPVLFTVENEAAVMESHNHTCMYSYGHMLQYMSCFGFSFWVQTCHHLACVCKGYEWDAGVLMYGVCMLYQRCMNIVT